MNKYRSTLQTMHEDREPELGHTNIWRQEEEAEEEQAMRARRVTGGGGKVGA